MEWKTKLKKKPYPYRRWCKARVSIKCKIIFKTAYSRTKVCPECAKKLSSLRLNTKRYLKMEKKPQYEETARWKDEETCELTFTENRILKTPEGKLLGESVQKVTVEGKKSDMEYNLNLKLEELQKQEQESINLVEKLKSFGKKPFITPEMVRIKKAVAEIHKSEEMEKIEEKLRRIDEALTEKKEFIKIRQKTLSTAPKKGSL